MDAANPPSYHWSHVWSLTVGGVVVLAALGGLLFYFYPRASGPTIPATKLAGAPAPPDPRVTYRGPYQNVSPDAKYVGDAACVSCHDKETASFHKHPMGRSLLPMSTFTGEPSYEGHHNPYEAEGSRFDVLREGGRVIHRETRLGANGEPVYVFDTPVDYVIGSGTHGYSYLTARDGFLFQTPISWFSQKQIWDKSPGFNRDMFPGRPVHAECLYCHANRVHPHSGANNHYDPPVFSGSVIGCERCHGPGGKHVEGGGILDIVNPANQEHMTPALRDAVCEQCHLEGEARVLRRGRNLYDFRPGLPLDTVWDVFVHAAQPGEKYRAVSHVEQMHESRCYLAGSGQKKMSCVTCHNPHDYVEPARQSAYYRKKCLDCHAEHGCTEPLEARLKKSKDDNCVQCHMPPVSSIDIVHNASTDHRILRSPTAHAAAPDKPPDTTSEFRLRPFYRDRIDRDDPELMRDLSLALAHSHAPPQLSLGLLEGALRRAPDDVELWEAKARTLELAKLPGEALTAYEKVLSLQPDRERSLVQAAVLSYNPRQPEKALAYWRRAVELDPWSPGYRANLFGCLADKGAWDEARPHAQAWLRLDPGSIAARRAWITCLLKAGKKEEARKEFAVIEAMDPNNLGDLRRWFERQLR